MTTNVRGNYTITTHVSCKYLGVGKGAQALTVHDFCISMTLKKFVLSCCVSVPLSLCCQSL